ncbi:MULTISPECIES: hypothetical protein [Vibrio]|uniref:hypothetical protein n=1 Tax=Vibrio TaxID=662 RepID=UPI000946F3A6|nr:MULTISPECIES: hypothetical protein [Vibrio]EIA1497044.1 hypothetical protein [Vibrio parahaemolyticus]ELA7323028.1 hypothetical protein [Vibrio parahaemolyticus]ELA9307051.1 hypothetical protein [Vibrio parahaemolyticus]MBD1567443.1 hypothetical protein [Vibrio sp. S12_S33]MBE3844514.1 hypothetical protein [Vibrio parahaemolyticus]
MLERIEKVLNLNDIAYESGETRMYIKFGGLCSQVKIHYDYATNTYKVSCGELRQLISSIVFFCMAFNMLNLPDPQFWTGYGAGLMFAIAIGNLFSVISANIQLLDLRAQLREEGIFLKHGS